MLVDLSHMRSDACYETFELLDELDPERTLPVVASHSGFHFGEQDYMLNADRVRMIADRGGGSG